MLQDDYEEILGNFNIIHCSVVLSYVINKHDRHIKAHLLILRNVFHNQNLFIDVLLFPYLVLCDIATYRALLCKDFNARKINNLAQVCGNCALSMMLP